MAFQVITYKFNKKVNSTKRPTVANELEIYNAIILKDQCSIISPAIKLNIGTTEATIPNYVFIPLWDRYYYVTDIQWETGVWVLRLKVDALASWKTEIGTQSLYVIRSAQDYNGDVIDTTYPTEGKPTITNQLMTSPWSLSQNNGYCYVVGIAGESTSYYAMTLAQLQIFLQDFVLSDAYCDSIFGSSDWLTTYPQLKVVADPLQYIVSIKWYPFEISGTSVTSLKYGWVPVAGFTELRKITNFLNSESYSVPINNRHPQASTRGSYLNNTHSKYTLLYPGFGQIDLDPAIVSKSASLFTSVIVDVRTGEGTLYIEDDSLYVINQVSSQLGVDYQIGQIAKPGYGFGQYMQSGMSAIGSIATGNVSGVVGAVSGGIGDYVKSKIPSLRTVGTNGGINNLFGVITLQAEFDILIDEDRTNKGRPLCSTRTINTLSGFIMVENANVQINAMEAEQQEIRSYMEGGFFYE